MPTYECRCIGTDNFLKLNEKKTDIVKFLSTFDGKRQLMSTVSFDNDYFIQPATSIKSFGVGSG